MADWKLASCPSYGDAGTGLVRGDRASEWEGGALNPGQFCLRGPGAGAGLLASLPWSPRLCNGMKVAGAVPGTEPTCQATRCPSSSASGEDRNGHASLEGRLAGRGRLQSLGEAWPPPSSCLSAGRDRGHAACSCCQRVGAS